MALHVDISVALAALDISCAFDVDSGKSVALVGASGAGKTTILRSIAGLIRPKQGRIAWGNDLWFAAQQDVCEPPQARNCAMVFAGYALFKHMSALENAAFGLRASGVSANNALETAHAMLDLVGVGSLANRKAALLSSGEAQRVAIARALAMQSRVLLLDEPLSAIDVEQRTRVRDALTATVSESSMSCVLVTHDPVEAMLFSDQLIVLERGRVVQTGTAAELRERPNSTYIAAFSGVNLFRGVAQPVGGELSEVKVEGGLLVIPGKFSGQIALVVDPDAVVLSKIHTDSSARNVLFGPIARVVPDGASLRVTVASQPHIIARITRQSAQDLALEPGSSVYATFKASEIRVH